MMKRFIALTIISVVVAGWIHGTVNSIGTFTLLRGGGGWSVGIDAAQDGTIIKKNDSAFAYRLDKTTKTWVNLVTQSSMPVANFGFYPTTGTSQQLQSGGGVYDARVCPSNSQILYMAYAGHVFVSSNQGTTWALTGFTKVAMGPNNSFRMYGAKLAIDPANCNNVYLGTEMNGVWNSSDGGTTWAQLQTIPASVPNENIRTFTTCSGTVGSNTITCASTNAVAGEGIADSTNPGAFPGSTVISNISNVITISNNLQANVLTTDTLVEDAISNGDFPAYNIAFDSASGTTGGKTNTIVIGAHGTSPSISTDAGVTWSLTTGGPTIVQHMAFGPSGDTLWACGGFDGSGVLSKFLSGTWSSTTAPSGCHSVAVDPADATHIVIVSDGGKIGQTTNSGASWSTLRPFVRSCTGDIPWLCTTNEFYMSNGDVVFDAAMPNVCGTSSNCVIEGEGIGVWFTTPASSGTITWNSITKGDESLVGQTVTATNGVPLTGFQDRGIFVGNSNVFPSNTTWTQNLINWSLIVAFDFGIAPTNPNYVTSILSGFGFGNTNESGFSTDGGNNWEWFNDWFYTVQPSALADDGTGQVEITVPSTTGLTTWTAGSGSIIQILSNNNFQSVTLPSLASQLFWPVTVVDSTHIILQGSHYVSTLSSSGGVWNVGTYTVPKSDWNGNLAITNVSSDSGKIKITVFNSHNGLSNGLPVCIVGVVGTTEANGCWISGSTSGNNFDLIGSTFVNAYVSGGDVKWTVPQGGYIASADSQMTVYVPANNSFPQCTTDGGKTWTEFNTVPSGTSVGGSTGWTFAYYAAAHAATPDHVTAKTIYLYNSGIVTNDSHAGVYVTTNCSTPTLQAAHGFTGAGTQDQLKAVPGNAGNLFFIPGAQGGGTINHPGATALSRSTDGGVTWTSIPNVAEPRSISLGAIAPGKTYPTLYMLGWVSNAYGIWRSTDADQATPTWTKVGDYPLGSADTNFGIAADDLTWNKWYVCFSGSGCAYGYQNYLLKRDLDPAANDNSPAFLREAG